MRYLQRVFTGIKSAFFGHQIAAYQCLPHPSFNFITTAHRMFTHSIFGNILYYGCIQDYPVRCSSLCPSKKGNREFCWSVCHCLLEIRDAPSAETSFPGPRQLLSHIKLPISCSLCLLVMSCLW